MRTFYEFFAGGGMARAGLGPGWTCLFANDFDPRKAAAYRDNFGLDDLVVGDVAKLTPDALPGRADLAWASFPCQDLSLAGAGKGLSEEGRSGAFYPFWRLIESLGQGGRAPRLIVLENVLGAVTSQGGRDFSVLCESLARQGYRFGALVIDAALFTAQSRPRLFIIGAAPEVEIDPALTAPAAIGPFQTQALVAAVEALPAAARKAHVWWRLSPPPGSPPRLPDILEEQPADVRWRTPQETGRLLDLMAPLHRAKVAAALSSGGRLAGCVYRRTRGGVQRAEVRFDGLAGCLRTPAGGSSRQFLLLVEGGEVRSRLLSGREAARLMGLADGYRLPARYNDAYRLAGDGVAVPVVRHLAERLLEPLLNGAARQAA